MRKYFNPFDFLYIVKYGGLTREEVASLIRSNIELLTDKALLIIEAIGFVTLILSLVHKR